MRGVACAGVPARSTTHLQIRIQVIESPAAVGFGVVGKSRGLGVLVRGFVPRLSAQPLTGPLAGIGDD